MKKFWSSRWKSSTQPRKRKKYVHNAPLHVRRKFFSAHLSKELREKYGKRSFPVRKGDEIEVMRGKFKARKGRVSRLDLKKIKVYAEGITRKKVDGSDVQVPFHPSNLRITDLNLEDEKRLKALKRKEKEEAHGKKTLKKAPSAKVLESKKKEKKVGSKA